NRFWQNSSKVIVKSWLSVLPNGLIEVPMRIIDPSEISVDLLVAAARKAEHGTLLGFKVPIGWKDADTDRTMLRITREAADRTGLPIMTHVSGACIPLSEIITYLRKGDVISHIYSGLHGREVLNGSAEARDSFRHAKERGIVMDIAFGVEKHFSWNTFLREFGEGLAADTVSTDVVDFTYKCPDYPVSDLYGLLSALYAAGVNRDELYRAVIDTPAKQMGIDLQSLNNTLVIRPLKEEERSFSKTEGVVTGDTVFSPMLFVDRGRIITDRLTCRDK
ncbi:MAG: hypothetical protein IJK38_12510, partial [Oscillospiraceae bacterium]|nr:hypothetical protein [Oscillospiraceae bacterium]